MALGLSVPQRPGNTLMMKKNVLDFQRKNGAGQGEKRLKDMFDSGAPHSQAILFLAFANSDSLFISGSEVIFFNISNVAVVLSVVNKSNWCEVK